MPTDCESEGSRSAEQDVLQRPHGRSEFSTENGRFPDTAKIRDDGFWVHDITCVFEGLEALGLSIPVPGTKPKRRGQPKKEPQEQKPKKRPRGRPRKNP